MIVPKVIDIYITDKCDLKCNMCNIGINNRLKDKQKIAISRAGEEVTKDRITIDDCINIIKQASEMKPKPSIYISGGEPFLQKEKVIALLKEANKFNIKVGMNSNATFLNEDIIREVVTNNLEGITLSLDGTQETHNYIRGSKNSYKNVINAIQLFAKIKKEKNTIYPKVFILMAITPDNYLEVEDIKELASTLDINAITFSHYVYTSSEQIIEHRKIKNLNTDIDKPLNTIGGIYSESLKQMDFDSFYKKMENMKTQNNINYTFSPKLNTKEEIIQYYTKPMDIMNKHFEPHCKWIHDRIDINSDGNIMFGYPCFQVVLGNIKKDKMIKVFNENQINTVRDYLDNNHNLPACRRCCGNRKK